MTSRRLLTPVAKALLDAADYIEQNGHAKRSYYEHVVGGGDVPPRACVVGALKLFASNDVYDQAVKRLSEHISDGLSLTSHKRLSIYIWNDARERTANEVISAMRSAAIENKQ